MYFVQVTLKQAFQEHIDRLYLFPNQLREAGFDPENFGLGYDLQSGARAHQSLKWCDTDKIGDANVRKRIRMLFAEHYLCAEFGPPQYGGDVSNDQLRLHQKGLVGLQRHEEISAVPNFKGRLSHEDTKQALFQLNEAVRRIAVGENDFADFPKSESYGDGPFKLFISRPQAEAKVSAYITGQPPREIFLSPEDQTILDEFATFVLDLQRNPLPQRPLPARRPAGKKAAL